MNFDVLLAKNFVVREKWHAQIRAEAFDVFNTPAFQAPNEVVGSSSFGVVTSATATSRRIMQFAVKLSF